MERHCTAEILRLSQGGVRGSRTETSFQTLPKLGLSLRPKLAEDMMAVQRVWAGWPFEV